MLQRIAIFGLGVLSVWLIVDVFELVDRRLPWILAVSATYVIGAYLILPRAVRMGLKILQRQHVPSFTITGDGLPGDPVNLALVSTAAPAPCSVRGCRLGGSGSAGYRQLVANGSRFRPQHAIPDRAIQHALSFWARPGHRISKAIDNSPRKRHHVRFWAQNLTDAETNWNSAAFWLNDERPADDEHALWVG